MDRLFGGKSKCLLVSVAQDPFSGSSLAQAKGLQDCCGRPEQQFGITSDIDADDWRRARPVSGPHARFTQRIDESHPLPRPKFLAVRLDLGGRFRRR